MGTFAPRQWVGARTRAACAGIAGRIALFAGELRVRAAIPRESGAGHGRNPAAIFLVVQDSGTPALGELGASPGMHDCLRRAFRNRPVCRPNYVGNRGVRELEFQKYAEFRSRSGSGSLPTVLGASTPTEFPISGSRL